MKNTFSWLARSKARTHAIAMILAALLLALLLSINGATKFTIALAVPTWFLVDGVLVSMAASYANPDNHKFSGSDILMGSLSAIAAAILLVGAGIYKLVWAN